MSDVIQAILSRRSVRRFTGEPISEGQLTSLLRAGMAAPSAHNSQPWRMLTISNRERMETLIPLTPWWGMLKTASAAIVICADLSCGDYNPKAIAAGCYAAMQNMLLAAHAMELGAVWLGINQGDPGYDRFCELLKIPQNFEVVGMIAIGHPAEEANPREDRFDSGKWRCEYWEHSN